MLTWPPQLDDLKDERKIARSDHRDDARLQQMLDAAIDEVSEKRAGEFDFSGEPPVVPVEPTPEQLEDPYFVYVVPLPPPTPKIIAGTIALAGHWYQRRYSGDGTGTVELGDGTSFRLPIITPEIEMMLGIGRSRKPNC